MVAGEARLASSPDRENHADDSVDANTISEEIEALISEVERYKSRGNAEFLKGRALAKHTAGKDLLRDACILYAEGLQALAEAEARLAAERRLVHQRESQTQQQQQQQQKQQWQLAEGQEDRSIRAAVNPVDNHDKSNATSNPPMSSPPASSSGSFPPENRTTRENDTTSSEGSNPPLSVVLAALSKRAGLVRPSLYLNLAACNLLLHEWDPAIACCTHVLEKCCGDIHSLAAEGGKDVKQIGGGVGSRSSSSSSSSSSNDDGTAPTPAPVLTAAASRGVPALEQDGGQRQTELDGKHHGSGGSSLVGGQSAPAGPRREEADDEGKAEDRSRSRDIAAKSLYRRAAARAGSGDLRAAREDLMGAARLRPRDVAIARELRSVEKQLAAANAKENLRRKTEEGRRRRQQQQQQQQQSDSTPASRTEIATTVCADGGNGATLRRAAATAAPRADEADAADSENARNNLDAGGDGNGGNGGGGDDDDGHRRKSFHVCDTANSRILNEEAGHGGCTGDNISSQGQQRGPPPSREAKNRVNYQDEDKEESKSTGGSQERPEDEAFPVWNGGECRDGLYAWNQSIREVQVCVKVPDWARARDVRVDIRRSRLSVAVVRRSENAGSAARRQGQDAIGNGRSSCGGVYVSAPAPGSAAAGHGDGKKAQDASAGGNSAPAAAAETVILAGCLSRPVEVDECLWTMEQAGRVLLYLQKELPADGEPGSEWWASVLEGDPEVDVLTCDAGSDVSQYPEHAKRRGARALWEHQNKTPEEKLKEERLRVARRQMEEEAEQRQRDLENAMKDPKKAELYRQLRAVMPDTPISIK